MRSKVFLIYDAGFEILFFTTLFMIFENLYNGLPTKETIGLRGALVL